MKFKHIALVLLIIIFITLFSRITYFQKSKYPYRYVGYFYPDIDNMEYWKESEAVDSVEECREWVDSMIIKYDATNYDYECGKDCYKGDPYDQGNQFTCRTSIE